MGRGEGTPQEGAPRPSGDGFRLSAAGMTDGGGEGYSVGGLGFVWCGGEGVGDGRLPVDDALVIRHRASPPSLLWPSGDSGVPGRWDATGPLPLNARRTTDRSGPDVRVGSYQVGCTVAKASKGPGSSCRGRAGVICPTLPVRPGAGHTGGFEFGAEGHRGLLGSVRPLHEGSLMSALPASLDGVGSF